MGESTQRFAGLPLFTSHNPSPVALRLATPVESVPASLSPRVITVPAGHRTPLWDGQTPSVDWALVAQLRQKASDRLTKILEVEQLSKTEQHERGRSIIARLIEENTADELTLGRALRTGVQEQALAAAVYDALFRLGRLQPLVDDDSIENIIIQGYDRVLVTRADGTKSAAHPVADSDEELIDFLSFIASRSEANDRSFNEANPRLHMRLDGGARLAAAAWVTPRPSVVIRRHRVMDATLGFLTQVGSVTQVMASFLAAAVKAQRSIVVAGGQGAGKTTFLRALCAEIPAWEAIGTFETEYELGLHELPDRHPIVYAWEERPGSGEIDMSGRRAGEFTINEALFDSFRFNLDRQIVGEVRGREILAMLKAMQSGAGSLSSTHAPNARTALQKLVTCATEAGPQISVDYATRSVAENIDLVVQLHVEKTPDVDGTPRISRWVKEIIAVSPGDSDSPFTTTTVFQARPDGAAVACVLPEKLNDLAAHGFDEPAFTREALGTAQLRGWSA